jgi:hypothetical protein
MEANWLNAAMIELAAWAILPARQQNVGLLSG